MIEANAFSAVGDYCTEEAFALQVFLLFIATRYAMDHSVLSRGTGQPLYRLSAILLAALVFILLPSAEVLSQQDECHLGSCDGIRVHNTTEYRYRLAFTLCCNHTVLDIDCTVVAANSNTPLSFPHNCKLLEWRFCDDLPDGVCYTWHPEDCVLDVHYCP